METPKKTSRELVIEWLNNNGFEKPTSKILPMDNGHLKPVVSVILQCMDYVNAAETFEKLQFPIVKTVAATTIGDQLQSMQPSMESPPIKRQYRDHMGNHVTEHESGSRTVHSYESVHLYGSYGHSFGQGYFIVNESGEMIFASRDPEQYNTLAEKCRPFWKLLKGLQEKFPGYRIEMSRGERLAVNDKIMKGFLFYPGMLRLREGMDVEAEIQKEIDFISNEIQLDIDRGRIVKGEYGAE